MAKKPTVTTVASGYYGRQALNDNFEALRDAFDNTLSRDGSTPNAMGADFDMNGYRILNAGQIDTDALYLNGIAVRSATDVEFQTTYLTASYTGNGSTVAYALTANPQSEGNVSIYIDGVYQNKDTFSLSGTTITFSEAPPLNSAIEIVYPTNTDTLNGSDASAITYNQGGTGAQDRTVKQKLQETVSVKDFGAVGDGVTDDSAAIQAAVDAMSAAGGGIVYFPKPSSKYNIGSTTIILKSQVQMRGQGRESTQISGSNDVFQLGNPTHGAAFNCSIRDLKLTTTDATKACVLVSGGSAAGDTPSGELNASQVKFDGDNAWRFDTANFFYSGFWEIDGCSFKKHTHFSTTQALNDQGYGMLVNTVRISNCTWNTTGAPTGDWACKISDASGHMTTRNFTIDNCVFEYSDDGGIIIYEGTGFNICGAWFYDMSSNTTVVQIQDGVGQVTLQNVFGRPVGFTAEIVNRSEAGVVMMNTNVDSIDNVTTQTSSSLPRVLHMFTNENAATLFETTFSDKGTFISSPAPAGLQAMTMTIPATTGTGTIGVPVSSLYDHTLFSRIVGFSFRMGSAGTSDPGATYDWGIRLRDSTNGTLSSWTNANTAVAAYETVDVEISGVMDGSDFTDWITTVAQNNLYIDVIKNGSGNTVNQFEATIYVM